MDMNLLKYLAFIKTVEYGSFTKAGEVLRYSQSGISRMIRDLETEWDLTLLERGRAGVRLTHEKLELDEQALIALNLKYQLLAEHLREEPEVAVTYFCPDARKSGGAYVTVDGTVQKIDLDGRRIVMADGTAIALDDIFDIAGARFAVLP